MTPLLQMTDVQVHFGGVHALDGASLSIERGDLLGLIGPNGSGKSTLIAAASRLTDVTAGRIAIDGHDYTRVPTHLVNRLGIARTFQTVRLISTMTVLRNVMLGASVAAVRRAPIVNWLRVDLARSDDRRARAIAHAALERVGMASAGHAYPQHLPYGSQRKVEIARALACDPKILLLDEPVNGMNQSERDEVSGLLLELHRDGMTQILVEHDVAMIQKVCSHVVALNFGKVIAAGTPGEVARDPLVREAYLGHRAAAAQDRAGSAAESRT